MRSGLPVLLVSAIAAIAEPQAPAIGLEVSARAFQPGELLVIAVTVPEPAGAVHVRAFDQDWPAFAMDERTWRAFAGADLETAPGDYTVQVRVDARSGTSRASRRVTVAPKAFSTRTLTVDDAFVNPPAEVRPRIEQESADLARLWRASSGPPRWTGAFVRPVPHDANSAFGSRSVFNGQPRSPHGGADFLSPAGTPVRAPAAGRVLLARDLYYTGGTVMIDHGAGVISLFAHLSAIDVAATTDVATGGIIGRVGATGRVTGAHLHWTVRVGGARVDPLSALYMFAERPRVSGPGTSRRRPL